MKPIRSIDFMLQDNMYITHELRFIDSFKFMASGMDKLISNITACGKCGSCHPGDCLKQYVEEGGSGSVIVVEIAY